MPRISEAYADCAIYLYASERAAKEGQNAGGSGFLINVPASIPNMGHVYAVTNRHLVDGSDDGKFWTIRLTKKGGGIDCVTTQRDDWLLHEDGDDVAVLPIGIKDDVKWWSVPTTKFLDREGIEVYQIGYGDDIFLVGRLISQSGIEKIRRSLASEPSPFPLIQNSQGKSRLASERPVSGKFGRYKRRLSKPTHL